MKNKYHRTKDKFFSGRCTGGRCWCCHAYGRKKDLYGNDLIHHTKEEAKRDLYGEG